MNYPKLALKDPDYLSVDFSRLVVLIGGHILVNDGEFTPRSLCIVDSSGSFGDHALKLSPTFDWLLGRDHHDHILLVPLKRV